MSNWQRLDTKIVYQNPYFTVHEDNVITPQGRSARYGWVESAPGVYVVALDDHGKVILTKQLRYTSGQPTWELPGGSTNGEDTVAAGKRELETKARLHADKWVSLSGEYYIWGGVATQRNTVLIARQLHQVKTPKPESDDMVNAVQAFSWSELKALLKSGELVDGESITALTLAGLHLGHLK